jgi:hypothetical protein
MATPLAIASLRLGAAEAVRYVRSAKIEQGRRPTDRSQPEECSLEQISAAGLQIQGLGVFLGIAFVVACVTGNQMAYLDQRFRSSNHIRRPYRVCKSRCERRGPG